MRIVNLTGHGIRLGSSATHLDPVHRARMRAEHVEEDTVLIPGPPSCELPIIHTYERYVEHLPEPADDVLYIVSGIVAGFANRDDVVSPGRVERNTNRDVVACHAFVRPHRLI